MASWMLVLALVAALMPLTLAHSWIEEYQVISQNGSFVGNRGYSRGYVPRTDPTFNGFSMMWMLPMPTARNLDGTARTRINSSDLLCHPAQRVANYTAQSPRLKVSPGDYVAMKYLENGHTTLPWNITGKPDGSGTVFVFGTTNPAADERIVDVMQWNTQGNGGNGRGFLMTAQNFDDGRCHQINCGSLSQQRQILAPNHVAGQPMSTVESWCETDLKIPDNVSAGILTTYWVWQWPTAPNQDCDSPAGKDEYYTTCADFEVSGAGNDPDKEVPFSMGIGGNPQSVAVSDFKSRIALTPTPSVVQMENNTVIGRLEPVSTAFASSCTAQASVITSLQFWPQVYVPNSCSVVSAFGTAAASSAAAAFNVDAAAYSTSSSSAWSAAFAAAKMAVPTPKPWSQAAQTQGIQMNATIAPANVVSAGSIPSPSAMSTVLANSSATSVSPLTDVVTITTVVVLTSTLAPSDHDSSSSAAQSAATYSSSANQAGLAVPAFSYGSANSAPSVLDSSLSTSFSGSYGMQTLVTDSTNPSPTSNPVIERRDHARRFM